MCREIRLGLIVLCMAAIAACTTPPTGSVGRLDVPVSPAKSWFPGLQMLNADCTSDCTGDKFCAAYQGNKICVKACDKVPDGGYWGAICTAPEGCCAHVVQLDGASAGLVRPGLIRSVDCSLLDTTTCESIKGDAGNQACKNYKWSDAHCADLPECIVYPGGTCGCTAIVGQAACEAKYCPWVSGIQCTTFGDPLCTIRKVAADCNGDCHWDGKYCQYN